MKTSLISFAFIMLSMLPILTKIFQELSNEELLRKCIHGETQNANESLNNIIRMKCPKQVFVERSVLQLYVNSVILQFNEGQFGIAKVFKKLGIQSGICFNIISDQVNRRSIQNSVNKASDKTKAKRKRLKAIKKGLLDTELHKEGGESYFKGDFSYKNKFCFFIFDFLAYRFLRKL